MAPHRLLTVISALLAAFAAVAGSPLVLLSHGARGSALAHTGLAGGLAAYCERPIEANGVPICRDRPGVDRVATRRRLVEEIDHFLRAALAGVAQRKETP